MSVNSAREEILGDVRRALRRDEKNEPVLFDVPGSTSPQVQDPVSQIRENCESQRGNLIERFESESIRIGARFYRADSAHVAFQHIESVCKARDAKRIVGWQAQAIADVGLRERLKERGVEFLTETTGREFIRTAEAADIGISGVDYALADTGTLVLLAGKGQARSISLLPPVHIAIVRPRQILSGLSDLFPILRADAKSRDLSSAITFITGPSRTADIELTLVVGVHGPQQLHVILLE
jgi:L-lactate dehydrogenase complex protein LldG